MKIAFCQSAHEVQPPGTPSNERSFDDLRDPALERSEHSAHGWFGQDDLARLEENANPGGT
ncbi:hypothetical protein ACIPRL_36045 [Streptomyces sp. NPDC090085]|uniref:hypothetical protein n=1 Tax=Streptomyces sp. NPDC090085 TaxID=3365943 RepID=UPI0038277F94